MKERCYLTKIVFDNNYSAPWWDSHRRQVEASSEVCIPPPWCWTPRGVPRALLGGRARTAQPTLRRTRCNFRPELCTCRYPFAGHLCIQRGCCSRCWWSWSSRESRRWGTPSPWWCSSPPWSRSWLWLARQWRQRTKTWICRPWSWWSSGCLVQALVSLQEKRMLI